MPSRYIAASPIQYIWKPAPPVLSIYGDVDTTMPVSQGVLLDDKMKEVGASHELIVRKGAIHGGPSALVNLDEYEPIWSFFDRNLK